MTKKVYLYSHSGEFIKKIILDDSDLSPSGEWNIPAYCTELVPPPEQSGYKLLFINNGWTFKKLPHNVYCYYNDGIESKIVKSDYAKHGGDVIFETIPTDIQLAEAFSKYIVKKQEKTQRELTDFVQSLIDEKAQEKNYDNGFACASYSNSSISKFKMEADAFIKWRDMVWTTCYEILALALNNKKYIASWENPIPTKLELRNALPTLIW